MPLWFCRLSILRFVLIKTEKAIAPKRNDPTDHHPSLLLVSYFYFLPTNSAEPESPIQEASRFVSRVPSVVSISSASS